MKIAIEALSWLFKWHWFLGTYLEMELYFLTNGFRVKSFVINWITEYALTSVIEVLAHASDFEIKFADGILGKSATQIKHFSSGSLSATDISETEHGCHWTKILKYYFQNQYPGKYGLSLQFFFTSKLRWYSSISVKYMRPHHSKIADFLSNVGF